MFRESRITLLQKYIDILKNYWFSIEEEKPLDQIKDASFTSETQDGMFLVNDLVNTVGRLNR